MNKSDPRPVADEEEGPTPQLGFDDDVHPSDRIQNVCVIRISTLNLVPVGIVRLEARFGNFLQSGPVEIRFTKPLKNFTSNDTLFKDYEAKTICCCFLLAWLGLAKSKFLPEK